MEDPAIGYSMMSFQWIFTEKKWTDHFVASVASQSGWKTNHLWKPRFSVPPYLYSWVFGVLYVENIPSSEFEGDPHVCCFFQNQKHLNKKKKCHLEDYSSLRRPFPIYPKSLILSAIIWFLKNTNRGISKAVSNTCFPFLLFHTQGTFQVFHPLCCLSHPKKMFLPPSFRHPSSRGAHLRFGSHWLWWSSSWWCSWCSGCRRTRSLWGSLRWSKGWRLKGVVLKNNYMANIS